MEKYTTWGEILYYGLVAEKCRVKSSGLWALGYKKRTLKHLKFLREISNMMLENDVTENDQKMCENLFSMLDEEKEIALFYPIDNKARNGRHTACFNIITEADIGRQNIRITRLISAILDDTIQEIESHRRINKPQIAMLIKSLHNLPRVFLTQGSDTLINGKQNNISTDQAIEYSLSYMDNKTKAKYIT